MNIQILHAIVFSFNPFSRQAETVPFVILLRLTPDEFTPQGRASGWVRVN